MSASGLARQKLLTDIRLVDVGIDECELGLVVLVFDGRLDNLEHGSDTGSTSNHEHVRGEGRTANQRLSHG